MTLLEAHRAEIVRLEAKVAAGEERERALRDLLQEIAGRDWSTPEYYGGSYDDEVHVCAFCGGNRLDNSGRTPRTEHAADCLLLRIDTALAQPPRPPAN